MSINTVIYYWIIVSILSGCGDSQNGLNVDSPGFDDEVSNVSVYRNSQYSVETLENITYAEGLSHSEWNGSDPTSMPLLLDIYLPNNSETMRPAMVFIHGGGFSGGDKQDVIPAYIPRYFAERGFVGISINYRLLSDYGSITSEIGTAVNELIGVSNEDKDQIKAMYPATRDAKAALRWIVVNAEQYGIDPESISLVGGSAGAFISIALGVGEPEDFTSEMSINEDSSLLTTNLETSVEVKAVVDFWGGAGTMNLLEMVYQRNRWDESDPPLCIIHGTEDTTVLFESAEELVDLYEFSGAYYEFYPLDGAGHGAWGIEVEGEGLDALSFDFIVRMLNLDIVEN